MAKNIIIIILTVLLVCNYAFALKVPDVILGKGIDPDLRELVEDYIIKILNEGRYVMNVATSAVESTTELESGEFKMDDSGVTKYFVVSNGSTNYRVQVTAIP